MADAPEAKPSTISFDYIKGPNFRVIHADGAFLAAAPNGLTISFYSERQPIPRRVVHRLSENGMVGEEIDEQKVVRDAMIRDVDVALALPLEVAKNLHKTLGQILEKYEAALKAVQKTGS